MNKANQEMGNGNVGKWSEGNRNEIEGETVDIDCRKAESAGPWIKLGMMLSGQEKIKNKSPSAKRKKTFFYCNFEKQ